MELMRWLSDSKEAILTQKIPSFVPGAPSIAEAVSKFYSGLVDDEDDAIIDEMFAYRQCHELGFALRGITVPKTYLGLGGDGHEVSFERADGFQRFYVDMESFYADMEEKW